LKIAENQNLQEYNSFGLAQSAKFLVELNSEEDILEAEHFAHTNGLKTLHLGEGSNVLFANDYHGLVMVNRLKGIRKLQEDTDSLLISVASGENWHQLVMKMAELGFSGIENLALIPGSVGAAPVQNIGAYGCEIADSIDSVAGIDLLNDSIETLYRKDCRFSYRQSIFKAELKERFIITRVVLRLSKQPKLKLSYKGLQEELATLKLDPGTLNIAKAVISIRRRKLHDPKELGNAGSFFKNPVLPRGPGMEFLDYFSEAPYYEVDGMIKIPAAWLIEQCGWKGYRKGGIGISPKHALVLVNYGNGTGGELLKLSKEIQESVLQKFGLQLATEVNIIE
jgi:UDP-N-acetylmuramate dehydrogenase